MDTVEFSSEISIPLSFTAACAENVEALEKPSMDCNALVLNSAPSAISALINRCFFGSAIGMYAYMHASANLAILQQRLEKVG